MLTSSCKSISAPAWFVNVELETRSRLAPLVSCMLPALVTGKPSNVTVPAPDRVSACPAGINRLPAAPLPNRVTPAAMFMPPFSVRTPLVLMEPLLTDNSPPSAESLASVNMPPSIESCSVVLVTLSTDWLPEGMETAPSAPVRSTSALPKGRLSVDQLAGSVQFSVPAPPSQVMAKGKFCASTPVWLSASSAGIKPMALQLAQVVVPSSNRP